ncbi:ribosomal protein S18-alanine N-acetyltransferase [Parachitinimonas caeni]|uniref:[Ribosomal protein bS18]-alanine N-acetyltransferase n=1 Tax=Parachitinimonas caeni TaxID=3031301 RepID=A0ABT7DW26_9NEIS|nr:ribosomal protein S18-alanine N-acetyltransferase [Parachitinimonas caeni]MDK2124265.1 ribosomal protein S18-alanine N-acetyltransferase [Parachitinimonas caeni]
MSIRIATDDDLPLLAAIEAQVQHSPWTERQFSQSIWLGHHTMVMEQEGQVIGFAVIMQVLDEATLLNIAIDPSQQGKGFGRLLLAEAIQHARRNLAKVLMLEVREGNQSARTLYQRVGFKEVGCRKQYYPTPNGHEDAILMDLAL